MFSETVGLKEMREILIDRSFPLASEAVKGIKFGGALAVGDLKGIPFCENSFLGLLICLGTEFIFISGLK